MQFGDITSLGLASWWSPVGIAQSAFEFIQVTTQLPPWASVFVFAGFFRLLLLPLSIKSLRFNANMNPHRPRFQELTKQLQEASRSPEGFMAASQEIRARHKELYREIGVSPSLAVFLFPVANITLAIGSFIAFERMARAFIPQLVVGGIWLWPSLCLPDPYLLIPIVSTLLVNVQMRVCLFFSLRKQMYRLLNDIVLACFVRYKYPSKPHALTSVERVPPPILGVYSVHGLDSDGASRLKHLEIFRIIDRAFAGGA